MRLVPQAILSLIATGVLVTGALAQSNDLQSGGNGPDTVYRAQLGIKGPSTNTCPNQAKVTGWVFTNYAGPVQVMIARRGQGVGHPVTIQAVPAANGQFMATYSQTVQIVAPMDAEYRLLVGGGSGVVSNWAPLKASCGIAMPNLELGG